MIEGLRFSCVYTLLVAQGVISDSRTVMVLVVLCIVGLVGLGLELTVPCAVPITLTIPVIVMPKWNDLIVRLVLRTKWRTAWCSLTLLDVGLMLGLSAILLSNC